MPRDHTESSLPDEDYCYLTTTGRASGKPREIEIWFALEGQTVYLLSGGRSGSHWVKNLVREPQVQVRIADRIWNGRARVIDDPSNETRARELLFAKYAPRYGGNLSDWRDRSLPIAVEFEHT